MSKKGFTLIELLVVIAIIAVLMAILMPALQRVKEQAREQVCAANLKNVGLCVIMYQQDFDFRMPDVGITPTKPYPQNGSRHNWCNGHLWWNDSGMALGPRADRSYWGTHFLNYSKERNIWGCPSFRRFVQTLATDLLYEDDYNGAATIENSAFALNGYLSTAKVNTWPHHANVVLALDHMEPRIENESRDMLFPNGNGEILTHFKAPENRANWYRGIFRHSIRASKAEETGGRLDILWLDGHLSKMREGDAPQEMLRRMFDPLEIFGNNP